MKKLFSITILSLSSLPLWAAESKIGDDNSLAGFFQNPMLLIMSIMALILLFVIWALAKVALMVIKKRMDEDIEKNNKSKIATTILLLFVTLKSNALSVAEESAPSYIFSQEALWTGMGVIFVEVLIIAYLFYIIKRFTREELAVAAKESKWAAWLQKIQKSTPIENEGDIDLGHDYDGIRELDNPIPPWWRWAFFATILFGPFYLYRYHVAHSAPLQVEELAIAIEEGEARKKEYLATSANAIDEDNIATMEGIEVAAGATIFAKNCVACHGAAGEGNAVGPNLTDEYWLHEGGLVNIFKSVKYGWPEKGMKSWQAEMSSLDMAQVATYVASLQGSNPPNAKEAQGDIWTADAADEVVDEATADAVVEEVAETEEN